MVKAPRLLLIATSLLLLAGIRCAQAGEIKIVSPGAYEDIEGPNGSGIWPEAARAQSIGHRSEFDALPVGGAWLTEIRFRPDGVVPVGEVASFGRVQFSLSVTQVDPLDISFTFAENITGAPVEVYNAAWSSTVINPNPPGAETRPFDFRFPLETPYFYNPADGNLLIDSIFEMPGSGVNGLARFDNDESNAFSEKRTIWSGPLGVDSPMSFAATFTGINEFVFIPEPSTTGDYNQNDILDAADIDDLTIQTAGGTNPAPYDLNADALVDDGDIKVWVGDLYNSWIGDANLDGQFNSSDLVTVLATGTYEVDVNSVWSTGDFNGDGRTNSSDLVAALADGGYEQGPRAAVSAVPEPASFVMLMVGLIGIAIRRRHVGP